MNDAAKDMNRDPQLDAAYRAGAEAGPPARLDDLIRAAARREVGSGPRPLVARRRWQMPLALAAVLVLSVSVVTTMREQGADRLDQPLPSISSNSSSDNSTDNKPRSAAKAEVMADAAAPPAMSAAAPATVVAPPAALAEPQAFAAEKRPAPPVVAEVPAPAPPAQPPMMARSESPAVASQGMVAESRNAEVPAAAPRALMRAPAATADAAPARSGAPVAAMSAPPAPWQDLVGKPAEQWRQRILELRRTQRLGEADAVASEFRKRFPDERLPEAGQP